MKIKNDWMKKRLKYKRFTEDIEKGKNYPRRIIKFKNRNKIL